MKLQRTHIFAIALGCLFLVWENLSSFLSLTCDQNSSCSTQKLLRNARRSLLSGNLENLTVLPYMESELERQYIEKIHDLPRSSGKSVIAMTLYGDDPLYVQGAVENILLLDTYFPGWSIRFYTPPSPEFKATYIDKLKSLGAEVVHPPEILRDVNGAIWRFLVADDPTVERYIFRDTDSRLNARDRFAVEEWIRSNKKYHTMRDHPNHRVIMNSGMWGGSNTGKSGVYHNKTMLQLLDDYLHANTTTQFLRRCHFADNNVLKEAIWPAVEEDGYLSHDPFLCHYAHLKTGGIDFPTPRDKNYQFVGQAFFAENNLPYEEHIEHVKKANSPSHCWRKETPSWLN